ncbi:glyceraldehyde-3-phosphate dehydrogenase [Fragilariopsis cylindrus CCMP1102]|uniref:Glyceraldehyde-3-phosphate dehydrogenase n=1 Tax=Fragilariopsis cylindrus CCMP1102 TaxID=635003 RepID=A0A1E7F5I8_9STRA|nr:glyceraldehyde-3-phosphate dehydrogenase [Fragilariopsis cylindrus CCMP1102]|eukprot:OEU13399.1 glyceraldehyde-3-phosphate dehydrogenase [Fragilariopsis cylindrus CCMP1102]
MVKCAVNGFGRIGRLTFRYAWEDPTLDIVHVNDVCSVESAAYLIKYDSVHGTWNKEVEINEDGSGFTVDGKLVTFSSEKDFTNVDWSSKGVELMMECTGKFVKVNNLEPYFEKCGIKQVVVSAPVKEEGALNVVLGCNHEKLSTETKLVTNASCTTNCLAPVVKVILENFGIKHGCITTIHDVTGTQSIVDMPNTKKTDLRRARSGMTNLCPTSTGSATAIIEIYPELKDKLNGLAVRVPLLNGSLTDCVFEVKRSVTKEEVNAALKAASESGPLKGILGYETKPLVSSDYTDDTRSSIIDALSTQVIDGTMVKIYAWYDNEAGYSKRMAELCNITAAMNITGTEPSFKYE